MSRWCSTSRPTRTCRRSRPLPAGADEQDALAAVTDFAWSLEVAHRVELYVEPWNAASLRTAEGAGYVREGLLRDHHRIGGRWCDMVLLAAVRP